MVETHDSKWYDQANTTSFLNVESLNGELQHRVMKADENGKERYVVPEGHFDGYDGYVRSEWELRKIMECNIVLSMHEIHHIRKLTTVVDALGKLGGINALLMASAAVFFAPIA